MGKALSEESFEELSHRVNYSSEGMYYVTVRTRNGDCVLGEVVSGAMIPSELGKIVEASWLRIPEHFPNTQLDVFQIMPNHIHGIVHIVRRATSKSPSPRMDLINQIRTKGDALPAWPLMKQDGVSLGKIIRSFKAEATKKIHDAGFGKFAWLGRFYEHVHPVR